jgi:hypothetical protein
VRWRIISLLAELYTDLEAEARSRGGRFGRRRMVLLDIAVHGLDRSSGSGCLLLLYKGGCAIHGWSDVLYKVACRGERGGEVGEERRGEEKRVGGERRRRWPPPPRVLNLVGGGALLFFLFCSLPPRGPSATEEI